MTAEMRFIRDLFLYAKILTLPVLALSLWHIFSLRTRTEKLGGKLLLRIVRPRVKFWKIISIAFCWIIIVGQGGYCVYLASDSRHSQPAELANQATNFVAILASVALAAVAWTGVYLELRDRGVLCGSSFAPWHSIRGWSWAGQGSTLHLKLRNAIATYGLDPRNHDIVESALREHLDARKFQETRECAVRSTGEMPSAGKSSTARLRKQFSLKYVMVVTALLGLNFAWLPLPACAVVGVGIVLGSCIVGLTLAEWITYVGVVFVLAALLTPAVVTNHASRRAPRAPRAVGAGTPTRSPAANPLPAKGR
jgi:hypothetical protein